MKRAILALLAAIAAICMVAARPAFAAGIRSYGPPVCGTGWVDIHVPSNSYYNVYNSTIGTNHTCVRVPNGHRAMFTVSRVDARHPWGYPNISSGWEWGEYTCHDHHGRCFHYPVQERHDGMPRTSVTVRDRSGAYNTTYDIWFNRSGGKPKGRDNGTELMIWLNHPGVWLLKVVRHVTIDHIQFKVMSWTARAHRTSWNYLAYVAVHPRTSVHGLWLNPFFRDAIHMHKLSPYWYMTAVDFGWELVHGGAGNSVTNFSLTGVR